MHKLIRTSTVAISLDYLLKGQISFLPDHFEVVAVSGADAHLEEVAKREIVRTVNVSMSRRINLIGAFQAVTDGRGRSNLSKVEIPSRLHRDKLWSL